MTKDFNLCFSKTFSARIYRGLVVVNAQILQIQKRHIRRAFCVVGFVCVCVFFVLVG